MAWVLGMSRSERKTVLILHSVRDGRHRYECENCCEVLPIRERSEFNFCPICGYRALVVEEGE